jgi:hypothetical protein
VWGRKGFKASISGWRSEVQGHSSNINYANRGLKIMPYFVLFAAFLTFFGFDLLDSDRQETLEMFLVIGSFVCVTSVMIYDLHLDATFESERLIFDRFMIESLEAFDLGDNARFLQLQESYEKFAISRGRMF